MPKLLKILDQLEQAIPDMRTALEGSEDYMEGDDEEAEDLELPPLPEDMEAEDEGPLPEEDGADEPMDLDTPPPFPTKKKKAPKLPF